MGTVYGVPREEAERWCTAWAREAAMLKLPCDANYWTLGAAWIAEQRKARRPGW
jgi:hypothetical protein